MELFKKQALLCGYCALSIQVLYTSMEFKHHSVALMETNRGSINFPDSYYQIKLLSHGTCWGTKLVSYSKQMSNTWTTLACGTDFTWGFLRRVAIGNQLGAKDWCILGGVTRYCQAISFICLRINDQLCKNTYAAAMSFYGLGFGNQFRPAVSRTFLAMELSVEGLCKVCRIFMFDLPPSSSH